MNKNLVTNLKSDYHMSQKDVAELMFLDTKTIMAIEKRALNKIRIIFQQRGLLAEDILED
jgi:DNA-binding XRE family transcriptional regulator